MYNTETIDGKLIITFGKILFFLIMYTISVAILGILFYLIFKINPFIDNNPSLYQSLLSSITNFIAAILILFLYSKYFDNDRTIYINFNKNKFKVDTFWGLSSGGGIITIGFIINYLIGSIEIKLSQVDHFTLALNSIIFLLIAISEELIFRGYILKKLIDVMSKYWALVLSALIFSLLHLFNPNYSLLSFLNIFFAGIILGLLFMRSKSIYGPVLQHFSWNYFQGPIFGFKISGINTNDTLFISTINSNNLLNGGNFGFENSLLCLFLQIIFIIILVLKKINAN